MKIFLQALINVYNTMRKWLKIKVFRIFLFVALYLHISWFCKVGHHFSTTNKVIYIGTGGVITPINSHYVTRLRFNAPCIQRLYRH